jgi:putative ABC transport system permease protein
VTYIELGWTDLAVASLLVLVNAAFSLALQLGIERRLLIAAARTVVQLLLVGLVLRALFESVSPLWTAFAAVIMVALAGREVLARQERRLTGGWTYGLGAGCMLMSAGLVTLFALGTAIRPDPWFDPRYSIPLLGMVLGNTMTGIALGLDTLSTGLARERPAVEARLALGATRWDATRPFVRRALRSGLMPIINSMAAAGIVALPGMMTGQILAGADPVDAVEYQVLIMFLIAGGTVLGAVTAVFGGVARLTDARHRLRLDRLADTT